MSIISNIVLIFTIINLNHSIRALEKQTKCIFEDSNSCVFTDVSVNETNLYFGPFSDDDDAVTNITFVDSEIIILTNEVCNNFHYLKIYEIKNVELQILEPFAFQNCTNLEWIDMKENNLITMDLFYFPTLINLQTIDIENNTIFDIDEREILFKLKNVENFYLNHNKFDCNRLRVILGSFERNKINYGSSSKKRIKESENVNGIDCISQKLRLESATSTYIDKIRETIDNVTEEVQKIHDKVNDVNDIQKKFNENSTNLAWTYNKTILSFEGSVTTFLENIEEQFETITYMDNRSINANIKIREIKVISNKNKDNLILLNTTKLPNLRNKIAKYRTSFNKTEIAAENKTRYIEFIYYISIALFFAITLLSIAVISILISIFWCLS